MRPVRAEDIAVDQPLPHALYAGRRLLAWRGTVITPDMLRIIADAPDLRFDTRAEPAGLDAGAAPDEPPARLLRTPRDEAAQAERARIRRHAQLRASASGTLEAARLRWERMPLGVEVGADPLTVGRPAVGGASGSRTRESGLEPALRARRAAGVDVVRATYRRLLEGHPLAPDGLMEVADDIIDAVARQAMVFPILALGLPRPVDSLPDQAYTTGALAIGMAAQLGWPRGEARLVGIAGFLCDAGMGLVPHAVRAAARPLTEIEINAVRRHPDYSLVLCRGVRLAGGAGGVGGGGGGGGLPERVLMAVSQHHERCDGSGYPRGLRADQLHDFSRVLAVAECFGAMTAPRAHRPALTAPAAMSELARLASGGGAGGGGVGGSGGLDRTAVRALVDLLGLYPAGSFVRLSSGHVARVAAGARPDAPDRPIVNLLRPTWGGRGRSALGSAIDLAAVEPKVLRVVEAVAAPDLT